ncbi:hypothetical protein PMAYCL1PPCAC_29882, partial [Pristionchus mayeri]
SRAAQGIKVGEREGGFSVRVPSEKESVTVSTIGDGFYLKMGLDVYKCSKGGAQLMRTINEKENSLNPTTFIKEFEGRKYAHRLDREEGILIDESKLDLNKHQVAAIHRHNLICLPWGMGVLEGSSPDNSPGIIHVNSLVMLPSFLDDSSPFLFFQSILHPNLVILNTNSG